ncbi:MAG TPA: hypothetical protein DCS07_14690 [Bdellovibrionales bacterium]|nr:MAG: hypothetical protein A2Z97_07420 [Bdellovibrionales bacterium GWB1_52_6]OFZ06520.1 MAG: hypothetical protein A2X97_17015 [Bdellovibrionales bacterium GWA1_52_35]OFZ42286.1 MAG: hypothetical protein A2070_06570 [Bdellovibrionales bacterium GWC1_52_8]HAR43858.1 hypothetical protein [Bdellovibrionales bacterium]HCM39524.1 hypothetical protein [Bdellovibrionales bacterium]
MKWLIFLALVAGNAYAKPITERVTVRALSLDARKNEYVVMFFEKAAYYRADPKLFSCLNLSVKEEKQVQVGYDPKNLSILKCAR